MTSSDDVPPVVATLEKQLDNADSADVRQEILSEFCRAGLLGHPRRIDHIVEFVRRFPRHIVARTPWAGIDASEFPTEFQRVENEWLEHRRANPTDPELARGHALFVAGADPIRALALLRDASTSHPDDPELCIDMARLCEDPALRLEFFQRARRLGGTQPNLLCWTGRAAVEADDIQVVSDTGTELLAMTDQARSAYGDHLDWPERGRDLWDRAQSVCCDPSGAHAVVSAIGEYANRMHWGHTFLGIVAVRRGDIEAASAHLERSVAIRGDHRLSSYGPSFLLVRELAALSAWQPIVKYLRACKNFWNPPSLDSWIATAEQGELPELPHQ